MANQFRNERVAVEIQREVNQILRQELRDPRVAEVNITDVKVTADLGKATVYYSLLSSLASDNQKAAQGLSKARGLIKRELARRLTLYKVPELEFQKDESIAYGDKIDAMLRQLDLD